MRPEGIAALIAVLGWVALVPSLLRAHPEVRRWAAVVAALVVAFTAVWGWAGWDALPRELLLVLREGPEWIVLQGVLEAHPFLWDGAAGGLVPLRQAVWLHLLEAVVAAGLLATLARAVVGPVGAVAVVAGFLLNPWLVHATLSAGPAPSITWVVLLAAQAAAARHAPQAWVRWVAVIVVAAATVAAVRLRHELLVLGAPATGWVIVAAVRPELARRADAMVGRAPAWALLALAVLATSAGLHLADLAVRTVLSSGVTIAGAAPWSRAHLLTLRLPVDALGFLPVGLAVAALVGLVVALPRGVLPLLLGVGTLQLARLYAAAGHLGAAPYETLRYEAALLAPLALLAALGVHWVAERLDRPARAVWWSVLLISPLLPRIAAPDEVDAPPWDPVETTQGVGGRLWVEALERWPDCLLVTRLRHEDSAGARWVTTYVGGPLGIAVPAPGAPHVPPALKEAGLRPDAAPADVRAAAETADLCALFVVGLDCALPDADCAAWTSEPPLHEVRADVPELNTHHPVHAGPLRLGIHPLGGAPTAAR